MRPEELTNCSNDLCFDTKLVGESTSEVRDASFSVSSHIWDLSDVIIHMSTGEHKDHYQAQDCPYVSVLEHRKDVWVCYRAEGEDTNHNSHSCDQLGPVEGSRQGRIISGWQMPL